MCIATDISILCLYRAIVILYIRSYVTIYVHIMPLRPCICVTQSVLVINILIGACNITLATK